MDIKLEKGHYYLIDEVNKSREIFMVKDITPDGAYKIDGAIIDYGEESQPFIIEGLYSNDDFSPCRFPLEISKEEYFDAQEFATYSEYYRDKFISALDNICKQKRGKADYIAKKDEGRDE